MHPSLEFYLDTLSGDAWPVTCPASSWRCPLCLLLSCCRGARQRGREGGGPEEEEEQERQGQLQERDNDALDELCDCGPEEFKRCQD